MGDLTKNISRHELRCNGTDCDGEGNNCGIDTMDWETIEVVQDCCDYFATLLGFGRVFCTITSAARCMNHNNRPMSEGGAGSNENSQHPLYRAIDFRIRGVAPSTIYNYLDKKYPGKYGIGRYTTFTHIDTRTNGPARWRS